MRFSLCLVALLAASTFAQPDGGPRRMGGPGGGPGGAERKLVSRFDEDKDGVLNAAERAKARAFIKEDGAGRRGPGRRPGPRAGAEPGKPGPQVSPSEVKVYPDAPLYDTSTFRTLFFEFENPDWEKELADFYNSDVEVPATLTVDGVKYPGVGIHFRGASSYFMVPEGSKRSLNVAMDFTDSKQRLYGHKTLNLLNSHGDASYMSSVLYSAIAREHIPAPRANHVRVVINGESWGVYVSVEQFNKDFVQEHFPASKSKGSEARWKVKGSPGGRSGLEYIGDDIAPYKQRYQIKSKDDDKDWADLVNLCRVLNETPSDELEAAIRPILDVDAVLWFLALDVSLVNSDGYWTRASDYSIYKDPKGIFHIIPHDMNEAFSGSLGGPGPGGPGGPGPGGPGGGGFGRAPEEEPETSPPPGEAPAPRRMGPRGPAYELAPLIGLDDATKPLRSKLLAVPSLRARYLANVRAIAEQLDWSTLGPKVAAHRSLIEEALAADTRKSSSLAAFQRATADEPSKEGRPNLRAFADLRRAFLLSKTEAAR